MSLAWLLYVVTFPIGHATALTDMYTAAAIAPTIFTAHLFGIRGARWVAIGFIPAQVVLFLNNGHSFGWDMFAGIEGFFALSSIPLIGLYVGWASDLRHRLEALHVERDRFVAAVAHDIKNPLTGVIGLSLTLAEDPTLDPEPRELAALIAAEAQVATDVIEDLSVTALRNSGQFTIRAASFDPLEDVAAAAQRIGAGVSASSERTIWADRKRFRQILQNLASNAERHGAPPYEFVIARHGSQVWVSLTDRGGGIPADAVDRLFEPFGMVGVSGHVESTGLGLSSSRVLATLMAGDLSYVRNEGVTEFRLSLPTPQAPISTTNSEATTEKPSA